MIEVIFRKTNTVFGYLQSALHILRWGRFGKYQHVEIRFDGVDSTTKNRRCWSSSERKDANGKNGVRFTGEIACNPKKWVRYEIDIGDETGNCQYKLWVFCKALVGFLYDYRGILAFVIPRFVKQNKQRYYCSEAVASALVSMSIGVNFKSVQISPSKLAELLDKMPNVRRYSRNRNAGDNDGT